MEIFDGITPEILEGMIEISESEISAKILESLFVSRSLEVPYHELLEKVAQRYKNLLNYEEWMESLEKLEKKGLLVTKRRSPPEVMIAQTGLEALRISKLVERIVFEPLTRYLSEVLKLPGDDVTEGTNEIRRVYIDTLKGITSSCSF